MQPKRTSINAQSAFSKCVQQWFQKVDAFSPVFPMRIILYVLALVHYNTELLEHYSEQPRYAVMFYVGGC